MLEKLFDSGQLWKGRERQRINSDVIPSGYPEIDEALVGEGWEAGSLTELLVEQPGCGEIRMLLPLLARLSQQSGWILWVSPPFTPYAPALLKAGIDLRQQLVVTHPDPKQCLWSMEQGLRSGGCIAVLGWLEPDDPHASRRLQLAAEQGDCFGFLFRRNQAMEQASCASTRIRLEPASGGSRMTLLRRRGGWPLPPQSADLGYQHLLRKDLGGPRALRSTN